MKTSQKSQNPSIMKKQIISFFIDFILLIVGTVIFAGVAIPLYLHGISRSLSMIAGAAAVLVFGLIVGCFEFRSLARLAGLKDTEECRHPLPSAGKLAWALACFLMFISAIPAFFGRPVSMNREELTASLHRGQR